MAKSKENPGRQMLINLNGSTKLNDVSKLALGEIAVNRGEKPELYTVYQSGGSEYIATFIDEKAVDAKIEALNMAQYALSAVVDGYVEALEKDVEGAYSGATAYTDTVSGNIETTILAFSGAVMSALTEGSDAIDQIAQNYINNGSGDDFFSLQFCFHH